LGQEPIEANDLEELSDDDELVGADGWQGGDFGGSSQKQLRQAEAAKNSPPPAKNLSDPNVLKKHISDMLAAAHSSFNELFSWDDQKMIAIRTYFAVLNTGMPIMNAAEIASVASGRDERTVRSWVADFENNKGWFSESVWGTNTKTPSLMADVEHRLWARKWVLANMGHRNDAPNSRAVDFSIAAHEHFGYTYDPTKPIISLNSLKCATGWLHTVVGAEYGLTKKGTFIDGHGKDHVIKQRKNFIQ
jgi:hypothetical protein